MKKTSEHLMRYSVHRLTLLTADKYTLKTLSLDCRLGFRGYTKD